MTSSQFSQAFIDSDRPHILTITNHGIHEWEVSPGLTDTGGQNIFVNQFSDALVRQGYKITIINRGGYRHPTTGVMRTGFHYKNPYQRIYYLEDKIDHFIRKEDMGDYLPGLEDALRDFLSQDGLPIDLLLTHYWDAGILGLSIQDLLPEGTPHIWTPHSLGAIKAKMFPAEQQIELRMDERLQAETYILDHVDGAGATSGTIRDSFRDDYDFTGKVYWLPPCVDMDRYHPQVIHDNDPIWGLLQEELRLPLEDLKNKKIITEISRTDHTKRKDILIRAFAKAHQEEPDSLLVVSINQEQKELAVELLNLIKDLGIQESTAVVGSIWEELPALYNITDIYCTPSIMEGFGMSAQEAAATGVPVIASDKVVFVTEYLLGEQPLEVDLPDGHPYSQGEGALVVPADDVDGFAAAMVSLLQDDPLREQMGKAAHDITVPYFSYDNIVSEFIAELSEAERG
jgi:mannosylfructose-phosphate synthase